MCDHNIGEKPIAIMYTYIYNRYAGTPESHLNVMTFFSLTGGCSEGLDAFIFFSKNKNKCSLKKNLNASRPSEHPQSGGKCQNVLRDHRLQIYKISSWHLNGFPEGSNSGSTV